MPVKGEIELHACIYEARPDVVAVCHGHSDYIQLWGTFGLKLKAFTIDGMELVANGYGLYDKPYMIASAETGILMGKALGRHSVVLLAGHGAACVSTQGPEDCIQRLMTLEQLCKINWLAFTAMGKDYEKYAFDKETLEQHFKLSAAMKVKYATPGKDQTSDLCYYNAAWQRPSVRL